MNSAKSFSFSIALGLLATTAAAHQDDLLRSGPLDAFRPVGQWRGVAEAAAVPGKTELTIRGEGKILVNGATSGEPAPYLLSKAEYGDVRIEFEFMIPQASNSGIYVMGRYEVQILDSHGKAEPGFGDLGGIYERWDPSRPAGREGYDGIAPTANAALPPGEWQTIEIVFRAPRFDEAGEKTRDAVFEKVLVNGTLVQENAAVSGPTREAPLEEEAARGPIAIQGDHGPIAIRGFRVTSLDAADQARMAELDAYWAEVSRAVGAGDFEGYKATCHDEGVLISGSRKRCQSLAEALRGWKKGIDATRAGEMKASVDFRFSERLGDATTAYETGIFLYISQVPGEEPKADHVHLEAVLVKQDDGWKVIMEHQVGPASEAEWQALE
jgi:ketosteroid isomerase-like protein